LGEAEKIVRFKGTFVLFLVFLGLGGYIYFTEYRGREERQKQEEAKKRLFTAEAADVSEITLEFEDRTLTAVRKNDKNWEISSPAGLEADSEEWEQLASNFVRIEKEETVSTEKVDVTPYGLDKPVVKVTAKMKDGKTSGVLFGAENPRKTFHYAKRLDSDEVFLSPTSWGNNFKKSLTDLRYKKVLDFETDDIDSVRVVSTGKLEIEFQKSGMDWLIRKPIETPADAGEVSGFLSSIQFSRASAFAEDSLDAKAGGLETPTARVTLHDKKANVDKVLLFGKSPEKEKYYAKDQSRAPIFILGTEILQKAQQPLFGWRDKSVVQLGAEGSSGVDELEIVRGAEKVVFKKVGMDWQLSDGRKVQQGKVSAMPGSLESARATEIIDKPAGLGSYGLDKPRLSVTLRKAGKDIGSVSFGRDNTAAAGVYAKGSGSAVMTVGKELYDTFNVQLSDVLETQASPESPAK
jgi:hypothetical protein